MLMGVATAEMNFRSHAIHIRSFSVSSREGHTMKKIVIRKAGPVRLTSSAQTMYGCGCDA
ncbi:hypothetical protein F4556_005779 [Kitasatospora gansuensis]|uniref:Uncharacterized protein n=1 Tax=Kitasatospora gansuensis TaxID=258050 RepID=A0A7W7SH09_9ACTN|nr:hypothetical protein [Kitasatospora gansuensis]MBB4950244.1 hypothetical protein [Kitasatospora gansuensis]